MNSKRALVLDPKDNVAVAVDPIQAGDRIVVGIQRRNPSFYGGPGSDSVWF